MEKTPVQRAILVDLLVYGDDKAVNVGRRTGYHRNSISSGMTPLVEEGLIRNKGDGVYTLRDAGKEAAQGLIRGGDIPYSED